MERELHRRVKSAAAARGLKLWEATESAYNDWLSRIEGKQPTPPPSMLASDLGTEDNRLVENLIAMIRDGDKDRLPPIRLLLRDYHPKESRVETAKKKTAAQRGQHRRAS